MSQYFKIKASIFFFRYKAFKVGQKLDPGATDEQLLEILQIEIIFCLFFQSKTKLGYFNEIEPILVTFRICLIEFNLIICRAQVIA